LTKIFSARNGIRLWIWSITVLFLVAGTVYASDVSALYVRGYTVIPEPQKVELKSDDFQFDSGWRVELGQGVKADDVAVESLNQQLAERYQVSLDSGGRGIAVALRIEAGSVQIGEATDANKVALAEQAYRLELGRDGIRITANAPTGLFYGIETLVQLVKSERGKLWLPEGEIVDWPDVGFREVFWDEQQHLDHLEVLKKAVARAAFFKINAIALRLNEHFQYASAPALVNPDALSPAELQELTDYGLHYHLQIVPYLDGPAHVNFILQRPEYAQLREFPEEAFQMCSTNPETYKLLEGMYQDLINANKGVQYFHLSTDEAWFIGLAHNGQCDEQARAKELGSPSKLWVEYTQKTAAYLQNHGRKVIFWGETPLQAEDIPLLPAGLINGEVYGPVYNKAFGARGIREMIYTGQGDDPLFPAYYVLSPHEQVHSHMAEERAVRIFDELSYTSARKEADIIGAEVFGWCDEGPHQEIFWMDYAVGASAAWHPGSPDPHELMQSFYRLFYGHGSTQMGRLYQLMSTQAQFFGSSWDSIPSAVRPLVFGYSYGPGPYIPHIQTLPLPSVPSADYLHLDHNWQQDNANRLELVRKSMGENDELLNLLYANLSSVEFNRYNLEVYLSIARLCRQNLLMMELLEEINTDLEKAHEQAAKLHYTEAIAALDQALDTAERIRDQRNQALHDVTTSWYKTWVPRVREGNGRHVTPDPQDFVDTQTSEDARRGQSGLLYLIDREFVLPFGEWVNQVNGIRNRYAAAHNLPAREGKFDWQNTETLHSQPVDREL
jgi:hexosaminidase